MEMSVVNTVRENVWPLPFNAQGIEWLQGVGNTRIVEFSAGKNVFRDGEACANYLFLMEGVIRVHKISEEGHEITLYRIRAGEACELTTSCMLADDMYHAAAITETTTKIMLISKDCFQKALVHSDAFRRYVFVSVEKGMHDLLSLIEDVAFGAVDRRLARCLLANQDDMAIVPMTHQELAIDLGTAREVVSRALKKFEKQGWIHLHRGWLEVVNEKELNNLLKKCV